RESMSGRADLGRVFVPYPQTPILVAIPARSSKDGPAIAILGSTPPPVASRSNQVRHLIPPIYEISSSRRLPWVLHIGRIRPHIEESPSAGYNCANHGTQ